MSLNNFINFQVNSNIYYIVTPFKKINMRVRKMY